MKLSTTDCLVVFCVIHLMVTDPIYAGTNTGGSQKTNYPWDFSNLFYLRCNVSERKFRCCDDGANHCFGYNGGSFISSFYTGNEGTYYSPKIRMMVGLINSTCNKFKKYGTTTSSGKKS
ncbi:unnamed protein product [Schistosoma haematobium]|nr:unnamed protein product [Schistosoma haematobium]